MALGIPASTDDGKIEYMCRSQRVVVVMEIEPDGVSLYDDELSMEDSRLDRELPREKCGMPHGLMIVGIIGAVASLTVSAPLIAICFLGMWGTGVVIETNSNVGACCYERRSR